MGKHSSGETSKSESNYQPKHGKASTDPKSSTDASRIVGRLKSERAAGR